MAQQPPEIGREYRIQSKATGRELATPNRGGPGFWTDAPHVVPAGEGEGVLWEVEDADIGYRFKTGGPFRWEDMEGGQNLGGRLDSNADRQVYAHSANEGAYQKWRLFPDGEGYWQLVNVATGLALDGTPEDIYTMAPNDGAYQRWRFIP
ncbi:MAG TPA: RICIN domain-containing protein [Thermoleophilaceae bacterium]|jgi:hypothetical protein